MYVPWRCPMTGFIHSLHLDYSWLREYTCTICNQFDIFPKLLKFNGNITSPPSHHQQILCTFTTYISYNKPTLWTQCDMYSTPSSSSNSVPELIENGIPCQSWIRRLPVRQRLVTQYKTLQSPPAWPAPWYHLPINHYSLPMRPWQFSILLGIVLLPSWHFYFPTIITLDSQSGTYVV